MNRPRVCVWYTEITDRATGGRFRGGVHVPKGLATLCSFLFFFFFFLFFPAGKPETVTHETSVLHSFGKKKQTCLVGLVHAITPAYAQTCQPYEMPLTRSLTLAPTFPFPFPSPSALFPFVSVLYFRMGKYVLSFLLLFSPFLLLSATVIETTRHDDARCDAFCGDHHAAFTIPSFNYQRE